MHHVNIAILRQNPIYHNPQDISMEKNRTILLGVLVSILLLIAYQVNTQRDTLYYSIKVTTTYPHDSTAFTQGLVLKDGILYESTGLYGQTSVRKTMLTTGTLLEKVDLPPRYFGEGLTIHEDKIYQVTWRENTGFVYSPTDLHLVNQFSIPCEGWGLTHNGSHLILSNGSSTISFMNPHTFKITHTIQVTHQGTPVKDLNELEYVDGVIYANIWHRDEIVMIDPTDGSVHGWIDLEGIRGHLDSTEGIDVLNGIAYNPETQRLLVTGKYWPNILEIKLDPQ